jgi:hypothetical protein
MSSYSTRLPLMFFPGDYARSAVLSESVYRSVLRHVR